MDIEKYIGYYKNCVPDEICDGIMNYESYNFTRSTYSVHDGKLPDSDERVKMDECWVRAGGPYYQGIKDSYELVIQKYTTDLKEIYELYIGFIYIFLCFMSKRIW